MSRRTAGEGARWWTCGVALSFTLGLLSACEDADDREDDGPAYVVSVHPAPGSGICEGWGITLKFNRDPGLVESPHCVPDPTRQTGATRVFWAGGPPVEFTWGEGASLTVDYYFMSCHTPPAVLEEAFPKPGATVAADVLVAAGIVLAFNGEVVGDEEGHEPQFVVEGPDGWEWTPSVRVVGPVVMLGPPEPGLFEPGVTYTVRGEVTDRGGNATMIDFDFTIAADR